ncbi:MAG: hypothetical protein WAO71_00005, partial [Gallionella sp.]
SAANETSFTCQGDCRPSAMPNKVVLFMPIIIALPTVFHIEPKIFTLTAANQASHATLLAQVTIDPQAMQEIQNGLAAGKEVTVHQAPITQSGWTGSGYVITDPATGAGAYKIAGGANGAWLTMLATASASVLSLAVGLTGLYAAVWLVALLAIITTILIIAALVEGYDLKPYSASIDVIGACTFLPIFGYLGPVGVVAGILGLSIVIYLKLLAAVSREREAWYA